MNPKLDRSTPRKLLAVVLICIMVAQLMPTLPLSAAGSGANAAIAMSLLKESEATQLSTVSTGQPFRLLLTYSFSLASANGTYDGGVITVQLPSYFEVDMDALEQGKNADVLQDGIFVDDNGDGTQTITYLLADMLSPGSYNELGIKLKFDNLVTRNLTKADFVCDFTTYFKSTGSEALEECNAETMTKSITAVTNEKWQIKKSNEKGTLNTAEGKQTVGYTVDVDFDDELIGAGNRDVAYDRYGRLEFLSDAVAANVSRGTLSSLGTNGDGRGYVVVDTLPGTLANGNPSGARVVPGSVKLNGVALKPSDYYIESNTDQDLKIYFYKHGESTDQNTHNHDTVVGTSTRSIYTYDVEYPTANFEYPSNSPTDIEYQARNDVLLRYALLPSAERPNEAGVFYEVDANSVVSMGWRENAPLGLSFDVLKYLTVGQENGQPYRRPMTDDLTAVSAYGPVSFTLYRNEACTELALRVDGQPFEPQSLVEDVPLKSGKVTFSQLYPGTYWLMEETNNTGLVAPKKIKVVLHSNGKVTYWRYLADGTYATVANADAVEVENYAADDGVGILQFYKKGITASSSAESNLAGVTFGLHKKEGTAVGELVGTATSKSTGEVRFEGIPKGTYYLVEESLGSHVGEYPLDPSNKTEVVINANTINFLGSATTPGDSKFINRSIKGRFTFRKIDNSTGAVIAGGAGFDVVKSDTQPGTSYTPTFRITKAKFTSGVYLSDPLDVGTYWLKETDAPTRYSGSSKWYKVVVTANNTAYLTNGDSANLRDVGNDKLAGVTFIKYGSWGSDTKYTRLTGAEITIYSDSNFQNPVTPPTGQNIGRGNPFVTFIGSNTPAESEYLYLPAAPGGTTYYYKETKFPDGYSDSTAVTGSFVLKPSDRLAEEVFNTPSWGRLVIVKEDSTNAGKRLAGAKFQIYQEGTTTPVGSELTTNADGIAVSELLDTANGKKYYVKEVTAPTGYVALITDAHSIDGNGYGQVTAGGITPSNSLDANFPAAITTKVNGTVVRLKNDPKTAIKVIKKDSVLKVAMGGVVFTLYDTLENAQAGDPTKGTVVITGDTTGEALFTGLTPGKNYYLVETTPIAYAPQTAGLDGSNIFKITAPAASIGTLEYPLSNDRLAKLVLNKIAVDNYPASITPDLTAKFWIWPQKTTDAATDLAAAAIARDITIASTNEAGTLTVDGLKPGAYWVQERIAPKGYDANFPKLSGGAGDENAAYAAYPAAILFTLQAGDNQGGSYRVHPMTVPNNATHGKLIIKKVDQEDTTVNLVATFSLYKKLADNNYETTAAYTVTTNGTTGIGSIEHILPGTYKVVETTVPTGYVAATISDVEIVAGELKDLSAQAANWYKNPRQGLIRVKKTGTWTGTGTSPNFDMPLPGAIFAIYPTLTAAEDDRDHDNDGTGCVWKGETDSNGYATSSLLDPGTYYIREISAPEGFTPSAEIKEVTIAYNEATPSTATTWVMQSGARTPRIEVTYDNTPTTARIRLYKYDATKGHIEAALLDGAIFWLYEEVAIGDAVQDAEYVTPHPDPAKASTYKLRRMTTSGNPYTMVTGSNGTGIVISLPVEAENGKVYYLREVQAPEWFFASQEWVKVDVSAADKGKLVDAEAENTPYNKFEGDKTDDFGTGITGAYIVVFDDETKANAFNDGLFAGTIKDINIAAFSDANKAATYAKYGILDHAMSGKNGVFTFENLSANGVYYFVEALPANSAYTGNNSSEVQQYVRHNGVLKLKVNATGEGFVDSDPLYDSSLEFINERYGFIEIKKLSTIGGVETPVQGAVFRIYPAKLKSGKTANCCDGVLGHAIDSSNCNYEIDTSKQYYERTTNSDGKWTALQVPPGHYIVVEHSVPEGFLKTAPDYHLEVKTNGQSAKIVNNYLVEKGASQTGNGPVYNTTIYGKFRFTKEFYKNASGVAGDSNVALDTDLKKAYFKLEKCDNPALPAAQQTWTAVSGYGNLEITNKTIYESGLLKAGTYRLVELETTDQKYTRMDPYVFEIQSGKITMADGPTDDVTGKTPYAGKNYPRADLVLHKIGSFGTSKLDNLNGVTFWLFANTGTANYAADLEHAKVNAANRYEATTKSQAYGSFANLKGTAIFRNVEPGKYWLYEAAVTGDMYDESLFSAIEVELAKGEVRVYGTPSSGNTLFGYTPVGASLNNPTTYGKIKIGKVDANETSVKLPGAKYTVYYAGATAPSGPAPSRTALAAMADKSEITIRGIGDVGDDGTTIDSATHADYGTAITGLLKPGYYWITETAANDGWFLNDTVYGPVKVTGNTVSDQSGTPYTNVKKLKITVYKRASTDAAGNYAAFNGNITVRLYDTLADAQNDTLATNNLHIGQKTTSRIGGTVAAPIYGAVFEDLVPGETYYVREFENSTIKQYIMDDNNPIRTITMTWNADKETTFVNIPMGRIAFKKYGEWLDGGYYRELDGVRFKVFSCDNLAGDNKQAVMVNGSQMIITTATQTGAQEPSIVGKGVGLSDYLPAGFYMLEEDNMGEDFGFLPYSGAALTLKVEPGVINKTYYDDIANDFASTLPTGTTYTTGGYKGIVNGALRGRFAVVKYKHNAKFDGKTGTDFLGVFEDSDKLTGGTATFDLYKKENDIWVKQASYNVATNQSTGMFTLPDNVYLAPGEYSVMETNAPSGYEADTTTRYTFDIVAGEEAVVYVPNKALRNLRFAKTSRAYGADPADDTPLQGAKFELYAGDRTLDDLTGIENIKPNDTVGTTWPNTTGDDADAGIAVSGTDGKFGWNNLPAGIYTLVEIAAPEGHRLPSVNRWLITVPETGELNDPYEHGSAFVNVVGSGRIMIEKRDAKNNTLSMVGAKFHIWNAVSDGSGGYKKDPNQTQALDDVTITDTTKPNYVLSNKLLPADDLGTWYIVEEYQAPDGYSLDAGYEPLLKAVKVLPVMVPTVTGNVNKISFTNVTNDYVYDNMEPGFKKNVLGANAATNPLLVEDAPFTFQLIHPSRTLIADGNNKLPYTSFVVTDERVELYTDVSGSTKVNASANDYGIKAVYVYAAYNLDRAATEGGTATSDQISAKIEYKVAGDATWYTLGHRGLTDDATNIAAVQAATANLQNLAGAGAGGADDFVQIAIDNTNVFADKVNQVVAVRVTYSGMEEFFVAGQNRLDMVFHKRTGAADTAEIRSARNWGKLNGTYTIRGTDGTTRERAFSRESAVLVTFPASDTVMPTISLETTITNPSAAYSLGSVVNYKVTGKNVTTGSNAELKRATLTFDLPAYTAFRLLGSTESIYDLINVTKLGSASSASVSRDDFEIVQEPVPAMRPDPDQPQNWIPLLDSAGNQVMTTRVTLIFDEELPGSGLTPLQPDEAYQVEFSVNISRAADRQLTTLSLRSFLGSMHFLEPWEGNENGTSFKRASTDTMTSDGALDKTLYDEDKSADYLIKDVPITLADDSSMSVYKLVRGAHDTQWLDNQGLAKTYPGGKLDYQLRVYNGLSREVDRLRLMDVLPYEDGDATKRDAYGNLNGRGIGDEIAKALLFGGYTVNAPDGTTPAVTLYVFLEANDGDNYWAARANGDGETKLTELPMMYNFDASWVAGQWVEVTDANKNTIDYTRVTAVGFDVDFGATTFKQGKTFSVDIHTTAPLYRPEDVDDFYGKYITNSMVASFRHVGEGENDVAEEEKDLRIIEPFPVHAQMELPPSIIGDIAWLDDNADGLQGAELPAPPISVMLVRTEYRANANPVTTRIPLAGNGGKTDQGYYEFDNVISNMRIDRTNVVSTDPADYVGGVYYTYHVEFELPKVGTTSCTPTTKQVNGGTIESAVSDNSDNHEDDSDIDAYGATEEFMVWVAADAQGNITGTRNMTIDAGFVLPGGLGDRVWFDDDQDGVQDAGERQMGVNGVLVNLYRSDASGNVIGNSIATTTTASNTTDSYFTQHGEGAGFYCFTDLVPGWYVVEFDIGELVDDATGEYLYAFTQGKQGGNNEVDSDAITNVADNNRVWRTGAIQVTSNNYNPNVDAGLREYAALGGFIFDDANYNDIIDLEYPIAGTVVELYEVDPNTNVRSAMPIDSTTTRSDGYYFFDDLLPGNYQVHFKMPDEYHSVQPNIGGDATKDSNLVGKESGATADHDCSHNCGWSEVITDLQYGEVRRNIDAGGRMYGAIGDYVWHDLNKDGVQDYGEDPIAGVEVQLQRRTGNDGIWQTVTKVDTQADGYYIFEGLESGPDCGYQYRVIFGQPTGGYVLTIPNNSLDTAADSDALATKIGSIGYPTIAIELGYGQIDLDWDAGFVQTTGVIGDYVWLDRNRNGRQDDDEWGIPGIAVILEHNESGDLFNALAWREFQYPDDDLTNSNPTYTNISGQYRFWDLPAGYYRVKAYLGDEYTVTIPYSEQADGETDSRGIANSVNGWYYTSSFYLDVDVNNPEAGIDLTWDFGIYTSDGGPKTGDATQLWIWLALAAAALVAGGAVVIIMRKRRLRNTDGDS